MDTVMDVKKLFERKGHEKFLLEQDNWLF